MATVKRLGVLTSGGDAPGMNAALRAIVRTAIAEEFAVTGIVRGLAGLLESEFVELDARSVSNILQLGGTVLKTSRSREFYEPESRAEAAHNLRAAKIDALIAVGGEGTFEGIHKLASEQQTVVVGVPATIDNDVYGTDYTIGFDTAANTALESIDKIRDTAASHDRAFFIEVMGRECGALALEVGLSGGAEAILIPEVGSDLDGVADRLEEGRRRGKTSFIIVVAEGAVEGGARTVAEAVRARVGLRYRVSVLGHIQRGGSPTSFDRALASRMGSAAVDAVSGGLSDVAVGVVRGSIKTLELEEILGRRQPPDEDLLRIAGVLAS